MSKVKPAWFLPRTRDHPPISALRLGDIVASPFEPEEAINGDPPLAIPPELLRTYEQPNWSWKKEFERSHSGGVFASFLSVVGVGPEIELSQAKAKSDIFDADKLVTEYFLPNKKYIQEALKDPDVKDELTGPNRRSKLFMITGLKVAYGATRALELMNKHGVHFQVAFNLSSVGAPIDVGPKTDVDTLTTEKLSAGKRDFVFGIQVRELRYKKGQVEHQKYDKGALYGQTLRDPLLEDGTEGEDEVDLEELEIDEPLLDELEGVQRRAVDANDGEENVEVAFL